MDVETLKADLRRRLGISNMPIAVLAVQDDRYILDGHHRFFLAKKESDKKIDGIVIRVQDVDLHDMKSVQAAVVRDFYWRYRKALRYPALRINQFNINTGPVDWLVYNLNYPIPEVHQMLLSIIAQSDGRKREIVMRDLEFAAQFGLIQED